MRLLRFNDRGGFSLTEFFEGDIPKYAILSHRWRAEEVTLADLRSGKAKHMDGYGKIQFCGEQAKRDGLEYFWVDSCCIDKTSSAELQEAINSMFKWYQDATKCYVYLSDVSRRQTGLAGTSTESWESAFRKSVWFRRGWTLQELIAPALVEFFSKEGEPLGNKSSLERHICETTGIPARALRGNPLSDFSVAERMSWAESRETFRQEDKAYSLLGIFDVCMPVIYSEGKEKAMQRLREEIEKASKGHNREYFSVPFSLSDAPDIEHFVAREYELSEIRKTLRGDGSRRTIVLHGLGGIGKTQLSIAYAKRHKDNYSAIFWLNIKDEDTVKQSFAKVAKQISRQYPSAIPLSDIEMTSNIDKVVESVKSWLSLPKNTRWLMIYDNYDNPKLRDRADPAAVDIKKFLPESYHGSIIITTRSAEVAIGRRLQIRKLSDLGDSLEILSTMSGRVGLETDPDAVRLAEELDGFPLALATAGAYIDQTGRSFSDYFRLYKTSWSKLGETSPGLGSYEDKTLYSTWQISFDYIEQRNPHSAKLLCFWAYFDNQDLWLELLQHVGPNDPKWLQEITRDEICFDSTLRVLINHGLVEVAVSSKKGIESKGYSIHACVHSWTIHALNREWDYDLAMLAVKLVGAHCSGDGDQWKWLLQGRLLQHATRCLYIFTNGSIAEERLPDQAFNLGHVFLDQGKFDPAEQIYRKGLEYFKNRRGSEHVSTLSAVHNLGHLYHNQGKLDLAEQMYLLVLQGKEQISGSGHTSILGTINNLGSLYCKQGKLDLAEQMYERVLRDRENILGPEHLSTLDTIIKLGILYYMQGKLDLAEQMYKQVFRARENILGPKHLSTLDTINNLGILYYTQGKLDLAKQMYKRVLRARESILGPEHLSTLDTINNLGILYHTQGKLDLAEPMYERALQGYQLAIDSDNLATYTPAIDAIFDLGTLLEDRGDLTKARIMYSKSLSGYEQVFGPEHSLSKKARKNFHAVDFAIEKKASGSKR